MKARFMNMLLSVLVSLNAICSVSAQNADGDARLKESVIVRRSLWCSAEAVRRERPK